MKTVTLPNGEAMPALGLGTWRMGEQTTEHAAEVAALRTAIQIGYRVIDTAEMYGDGGAEQVVGEALAGALGANDVGREALFIVSKVYPHNASRAGVLAACERSLKRLRLDCIDLYLLHWRGQHALADTVAGFEALRTRGHIRHWGVSNFDADDLKEVAAVRDGAPCAANQVYFSLTERGAAFELLPAMRQKSMPLMAYCPIDQGTLANDGALQTIGERHGGTAAQVALAWVLAQDGVVAIPKAVREAHLRENFEALQLVLSPEDLAEIDRRFPPPARKTSLAMR